LLIIWGEFDFLGAEIMSKRLANGARQRCASIKSAAMIGVSGIALAFGATAHAQESNTVEQITVSSSRLTAAGFDAPTPTQVVSAAQIEQMAYPSIYDSVAEMPALAGSRNPGTGNGNNSNGLNGLSVLDMRALGPVRTLTLVDSQRIGPGNINGVVDVGLLPQLLIERVDVVTGGASASWGSDAIAGVVNFITNKNFQGFKANIQGGITNYSDDESILAQAAWGTAVLNNRAHVEMSAEYYRNDGVPSRQPGLNGGPDGRNWFQEPQIATRTVAATPAGQPEDWILTPGQNNTYSYGGLITSGPLKGTSFGPGGTPYTFAYGTGCIGNFCQGGENTQNVITTSAWDAKLRRVSLFGRFSYDLSPDWNIYTTIAYGEVKSTAQVNQGAAQQGNLTIQCGNAAGGANAFLPASINQACISNNITSFSYGVSNLIFPQSPGVTIARKQPRYVLGIDGKFDAFGTSWNVTGYYQHAETHENVDITNVVLIPRYKAAIDAINVTAANVAQYPGATIGQVVCRSTAAYSSGCVPLNVIGINPVNPTAWAYINPKFGPFQGTQERQEAASLAFSSSPFKDWAGDVSVAFGFEYREEAYHALADWYGAGLSALSPVTPQYPADPVLATNGNNYYAGSFFNGSGNYHVREAFGEVGVPILDDASWGKLDVDLAGRFAQYSTAGDAATWKAGATWDTPVDGVRLRFVASRDVRAPNLSELSPAPLSSNNTVTARLTQSDGFGSVTAGQLVNVAASTQGNPQLKPEKSDNIEAGVVWQPSFIPGFQASFDYFSIKINHASFTPTPQQVVDLCQVSGNAAACNAFRLTGALGTNNPPFVNVQPFNLASTYTAGFDIAASYHQDLEDWGLAGVFTLVAHATHVNTFVSNTGIPNTEIFQYAGNNSNEGGGYTGGDFGIAPKWKSLITENWEYGKLNLTLIERLVSPGHIDPNWIQCDPGTCPTPTIQHATINYNNLPGAVYLDIGGSYEFTTGLEGFFKVENVFEKNPPIYGAVGVYDWLGRVYRIGVRVDM
jgi:outer membrane receptor protein involved in Fe transport